MHSAFYIPKLTYHTKTIRNWVGPLDQAMREVLNMLGRKAQVDRTGQIQVVGPRNIGACDWSQPTTNQNDLQKRALKHMGFDSFRPFQREIITAAMKKDVDILVQMPTNAGKTTLFALPALFDQCDQCCADQSTSACSKSFTQHDMSGLKYETCRSFTVVLSPLVALIADQVERLRTHYHVPAINLENAETTDMEYMLVSMPTDPENPDGEARLTPAKLALLTPEKLTKNPIIRKVLWDHHRAGRVSRIVVDEMHYVAGCDQTFRQVGTYVLVRMMWDIRTCVDLLCD